jgi:GntR family transcriptional regulator, rspAB operon transcriptional repressor
MSSLPARKSATPANRRPSATNRPSFPPGDLPPSSAPGESSGVKDIAVSPPRKLKRPADIAQQAFERLVEGILQGEFVSGQPLREAALARAWNVSRTPLREAVRRAAENGLLILRPNQAPLVRPLSIEDVRLLYNLREVLEVYALHAAWPALLGKPCARMMGWARRVAPHRGHWQERSLEFDLLVHHWWTKHCGNPWLRADLARHYQFLRIFQRWIGRDPAALLDGYHEHLAILDAIQNRDERRARAALKKHIRNSAQLIIRAIQNEGSDPQRPS